jgi:cytochrome c oxidase cbb3-type subunit 4
MDINWLRSLITVAAFAAFLGIVWWAYGPSRKQRFERDAMLPFEEDRDGQAPGRPDGRNR